MDICYCYDGTWEGFLTCIFESYVNREEPMAFLLPEDGPTLWTERQVPTDPYKARRVWEGLGKKTSPRFRHLMERAYLTCLPTRDLDLYTLIRRGFAEGKSLERDLTDPVMARVLLALRKMYTEQDHLKGFVRFSELDGVLVGEIEPKNRVLPILAPHFAARFNGEQFILHDRTHRQAIFYVNYKWAILPVEDFAMGPAGGTEKAFRELWRRYFRTIAIEGRTNPKCQSTHLPKRYRHVMTEFVTDQALETASTRKGEYQSPRGGINKGERKELTKGENAYV